MAGLLSLIQNESGGNFQAQNNAIGAGGLQGHFGRLQFGQARLQDAMNAGIIPQGFTPQQFMANPDIQQAVEQWHFADIDQQSQRLGLDRFIGQTVGGAVIDQDAIRAMAHLGGIGGAQRFLESNGQYNPADANGTSLLDYATRHGGGGNTPAQIGADTMAALGRQPNQPQGGLLSTTISSQNEPPARRSIWDNIPMLADPDRRARLAIGLEGLALNPNQGWMQSLQSGIDTRAEDRRMNQTAQWLRSQPGGEQFAAYFEATGDAQGAFQGYLQSQQPVAGPDPTAAIQNYEYLLSQGVDAETAATQAFGGGGTSIDINTAPTGPQIGTIPQGYQLVQDPETGTSRMERIPGGPEDTTETRSLAELGYDTKFAIVNDEITNALDIVNESGNWAAGYGSALSALPNTPARELAAAITTIKANLGFEELQAMRDASPTGGALGQVTERELAYLQSVQGSLDQARGPEELAATLREIQQRREAFRREREQIMSGAGQAVQQTGVRRYNPETGQLE